MARLFYPDRWLERAAIGLLNLDARDSRERGRDVGWRDRIGISSRAHRAAVKDDRHSLIVRILRAVGRNGTRRHQPLVVRRDDEIAAASGIVAERGSAPHRIG